MYKLFFFLLPLFSLQAQSPNEWAKFFIEGQKVARNEEAFQNFRRHPLISKFVEPVTEEQGEKYHRIILDEYAPLLIYKEIFRLSEKVGNPVVHFYDKLGRLSPTTIRSIKIAGDLQREFGEIRRMHIVQIGGGYGSLCKILWDLGGFKSYTLIDKRPCLTFAKKFLEKQGVRNVIFLDVDELIAGERLPSFDLLIDLYTFSTSAPFEKKIYLNKVISQASHGYLLSEEKGSLEEIRSIGLFPKMERELPLNTKMVLWSPLK